MRGMIKWKPFNSLFSNKDINNIINSRFKQTKPTIMEDKINEINYTLYNAITFNKEIQIKYWHINILKIINGKIDKINTNEKYILINKTRIYFKNLINIKEL